MFVRKMNPQPEDEVCFDPKYLGYDRSSGWSIYGKRQKNGIDEWVDEICAVKDPGGCQEVIWVAGDFGKAVSASSEEAYLEFVRLFPPRAVVPF